MQDLTQRMLALEQSANTFPVMCGTLDRIQQLLNEMEAGTMSEALRTRINNPSQEEEASDDYPNEEEDVHS